MNDQLVEREQELVLLRGLVEGLVAGRSAFVQITGPPGFGRTAMLNRAAALGRAAHMRVLHAAGAFAPESGADFVGQVVAGLGLDAAAYLAAPVVLACEVVLDEARDRPLMLVLDDVQWADERSRQWLRALVRRLAATPVLVVLATNGLGTPTESTLLELATEASMTAPAWHILRLRPLTAEGVDALAASVRPGDTDDGLGAILMRGTGGVPSVVRAVLATLVGGESGTSGNRGAELLSAAAEAKDDWVSRVVSSLPPEPAALADALAVCGTDFDWSQVCALAGLPLAAAARGGDVLRALGLAAAGSPVRLADSATVARILAELPQARRLELHTRAFDLGIRAGISPQWLARLLLGAPVGAAGAVWALRCEARRLRAEDRSQESARLLDRALREPVSNSERVGLATELAETEAVYAPEASDRRLADMLLHADVVGSAARIRAADLLVSRGRTAVSQRTIAAALAQPGADDGERSGLVALYWMSAYAIPEQPHSFVTDVPELPDDPTDPAQSCVAAWRTAVRGQDRVRAQSLARAGLAVSTHYDGPLGPRIVASSTLLLTGDLVEAKAGLDTVVAATRRNGMRALAAWALVARGSLAILLGDCDEAADDLTQMAVELPQAYWHPVLHGHACALGVALNLRRGMPDEARRIATEPMPTGSEYSIGWAQHLFARGLVKLVDGEPEVALEHFLECGRRMLGHQWTNPALLSWRIMAAVSYHACGRVTEARALADEECAAAETWGSPNNLDMVRGLAATVLGGR
jgi:hypothetical protein